MVEDNKIPAFGEMYPFKPHFFEQPESARQHYVDTGKGETVVMLHGNPTWSFFYRRMIAGLEDSFRCIVPDHIGCGFSDKPQEYNYTLKTHIDNLERLLDEKVLKENPDGKINLIVHDWGGAIGFGYATRYPERIGRIVILNTSAFLSRNIPLRINACRIPGFGDLAIRGFNAFAKCATFMTTVKPLPQEVKDAFVRPYDSWDNRIATLRFVQDIPMNPKVQSYPVLQEIDDKLHLLENHPVLIQWGAQDWCFDMSFYHEFRRRFSKAKLDVYNDAGHYLLEDAHERIVPKVKEFLQA